MSNPLIVVDKIVEYFVGKVCQSVGRHVGFLFHYKQNLKTLEDEKNNLQQQRTNVQEKVDQAEHRGEDIDNKVSDWLQEADKASQGVDTFMDVKAVKENMHCFNFSCPDYISRYRLSKQAEKKAVHVKHVTAEGGKISTISHPKKAPPELEFPYSRDYEGFQSRHEVFTGIVEALKDHKVNIIGVYGTGGVGKTTMVTRVGKLVKKDGTFDEVVIAVVSHDANVKKIQGQLANRLELSLDGELEEGRATQLWNRLDNGKKNLIILDDVWQQWEELDLNKIGIPITDRNKNCKVVLTSRNLEVWKNMKDHKGFKIEFLSEGEAWTLFKKKVGNDVDSPHQPLHDIARAVCKECQGLPVAINALGGALKDKEMRTWQDALHKLKNSMLKDIGGINSKVFISLKWSYDWLHSEDEKSCFLLCCLFPEDYDIPIDDLVRYYMTGRILHQGRKPNTLEEALYRVWTVVDTLKGCCLLLDGQSKHYVKMHDVVRDVAISIAEEDKSFLVKHGFRDWPDKAAYEHCSVISLMPHEMGEFPNELVCPKLHTLRLDCTVNNKFPLHIPNSFFGGTENLMVLDLNGVPMLPLPASLAKLAKLHMLCLNKCKLGDIAILKNLKDHLEILSLRNSDIKELPPEVGELTRLRLLDMTNCEMLGMIPRGVMSKLVLLEELYMPRTFNRWEGTSAEREISNVSLDELMSLTHLTTLHICIEDPALLPNRFSFENLARFIIIVGTQFPCWWSEGTLGLVNIHVENVLEFLLGNPTRKQSIRGSGFCPSTSFNHLSTLRVIGCRLKYLFSPSCARLLVQLESLQIISCSIMEGIIGTEGENDEDIVFHRLKFLRLGHLANLISFYPKKSNTATSSGSSSTHAQMALFNDKVAFPALEKLDIRTLPNITEIWDKKIRLAHQPFCPLHSLCVEDCGKLVYVVPSNMLPQLCNLESLALDSCPMVEVIVDLEKKEEGTQAAANNTIVPFPELSFLRLQRLQKIKGFCAFRSEEHRVFNTQVAFPKLETLVVHTFGEIALTDASELSLKHVEFFKCDEVSTVVSPHLFRRLQFVDLLNVTSCRGAREVFHLDELEVGEGQLCVGQLTQVRKVYLEDLPQLTCLWNKDPHRLLGLQSLEYLTIKNCPLLANLFTASVAKALGGLKVFYLSSCSTIEEVITIDEGHADAIDDDREIVFPKLEWLILKDLSNLKSFCTSNHNFNFPSLKRVVLKRCPKVQTFTSGSIRMPQILLSTRGNVCLTIEDLNKHLEQQHLKGEETTAEDEMFGDEERFSDRYSLWNI
ncbi:hypothetical protein Vadar_011235 [Vaccinium darrowii]|uniref:Uncharacterized protein n=1 Tax=Vaccinium darrowii TaxID=229202 RepID=A0ACB7XPY2_9ERIC|nr:hypothetical protein Vadar_011235 [Vaccinium darrowii]